MASLVVEDHLRIESFLAFRHFTSLDQKLSIQQRIGIALKPARVPGQVDQQPVQYLFGVRANGLCGSIGPANLLELRPFRTREIEGDVWPVGIEKRPVVPNRRARGRRLPNVLKYLGAAFGERRQDADSEVGGRATSDYPERQLVDPWLAIPHTTPRTLSNKTPAIDQEFQAVLQSPTRRWGFECIVNLLHGHAFRMASHSILNRPQILFSNSPCHLVRPLLRENSSRNVRH